jgi:hypothetical protein
MQHLFRRFRGPEQVTIIRSSDKHQLARYTEQ